MGHGPAFGLAGPPLPKAPQRRLPGEQGVHSPAMPAPAPLGGGPLGDEPDGGLGNSKGILKSDSLPGIYFNFPYLPVQFPYFPLLPHEMSLSCLIPHFIYIMFLTFQLHVHNVPFNLP